MISKKEIKQTSDRQTNDLLQRESYPREAIDHVRNIDGFATVISGVRRCGKSTFMSQLIKKEIETSPKTKVFYLNFDTPAMYGFAMDHFALIDDILADRNVTSIYMDEVQTVDGWEVYVRGKLDEGYRVTNDVLYTAMPEEQIQILSDYDYEGDLSCLTNGSNMVAVGDSISNVRTFKYKVGDKIWIAVKNGQIRSVDSNLTGRALLKSQIQYFHFDYIECTIGAIIYDVPSGSVPVYMSMDLYEQVTGKVPSSSTLNLYVKDGMDNAAVSAV